MAEQLGPDHESQPSEILDEEWFERFSQIASFQDYECLGGEQSVREEQRQKFLTGEIKNPDLDYPKLRTVDWKQRVQDLKTLKQEILAHGTDHLRAEMKTKKEVAKQAYRWRLNEKIAEALLLQATAEGNVRNFQRLTHFIYGKPDEEIFRYTVHSVRAQMSRHLSSDNQALKRAAQDFLAILPNNVPDAHISPLPSEATIEAAKTQTLEQLGHLINLPETKEKINSEQIQEAFQGALEQLKAEGWTVIVNPDRQFMSVDQEQKIVNIPETAQLDLTEVKKLILHEIGTHVARREFGESSSLRLLGLGLDRYLRGEEGVATMREQVLDEHVDDFSAFDGHFAVSLAEGLDGHPRDFRDVYEILERYYLVQALAKGTSESESVAMAQKNAWDRTVRTFRGTDCKTAGAAFTKDMVYREGNIAVWQVIGKQPDVMAILNLGKFNPANDRHIWILQTLGFTEAEFDAVEVEASMTKKS